MQFIRLTDSYKFKAFDCGDSDLNEFLLSDAKKYAKCLLSVTYLIEDENEIIAFFSVSNDRISIKESDKAVWRKIKKEFPHSKHRSDYPAVKTGRLGVNLSHQNLHIGTYILDFVKKTFITNNRTGCAFITVDALPSAISFYQKNGFKFLKTSANSTAATNTLPMYYNLSQLLD